MNRDPFSHFDAPYVLGALSPADRDAYEEHLRSCPDCAAAVREVAGLPGLLGRVSPADFSALDDLPELPAGLLPALLTEVRRERRRGRVRALVVAAAAVVTVAAASAALTTQVVDDGPGTAVPSPAAAPAQDMSVLEDAGVTAAVAVEPVRWGTRLTLTCRYESSEDEEYPTDSSYVLVVTTERGSERVASWRAVPGRTMTVAGATATGSADITGIEVRTAGGRPVLRLDRP